MQNLPNPQQFPPRPTSLAWILMGGMIRKGDTVIDATAGNGHDTVFLAECVGASGQVLAFDLQSAAIRAASKRVAENGYESVVRFHQCNHAQMGEFAAAGSVSAIMFNLGYLPGEDHTITTQRSETLKALESAKKLLAPGGCISIVCYPGHTQGADEATAVENCLSNTTSEGWRVARYSMIGTIKPAPFLMLAQKAWPKP